MKMEPISRRTLVAGSAGAVFASLAPAVAQESVVSESHSLLLDSESRYNLIIRQIEVAQEEVSRCAERAHNRYMKCPKPPYISPNASYSE